MSKVQAWCVAPAFILLMCIALPARAAVEGRFERTLTVSGAVSLSVTSGSGGIDVGTGPDGAVHVAGVIRANTWNATVSSDEVARAVKELEARPPIVQQGNTIRIGEIEDERIARLVAISYTVAVPRNTSVTSKTGSGSQSIAALAGGVTASSGSGALTVGAIEGPVEVRTGSGSIRVEGARGGIFSSSGSGSIKLGTVAGDARIRTGSGSNRFAGNRVERGRRVIRIRPYPRGGSEGRHQSVHGKREHRDRRHADHGVARHHQLGFHNARHPGGHVVSPAGTHQLRIDSHRSHTQGNDHRRARTRGHDW